MNEASSDARNATALATSSAVPRRRSTPNLMFRSIERAEASWPEAALNGVSMKDGATTLAVTPSGPSCTAMDRVSPTRPALDAV